jgi:PAS domain S-box-containing protein
MTEENPKTILLVEDEVLIAQMEKMILEKNGFRVITAYKGEKAVSVMDEIPGIDLILMDINLGSGMSGPEAAGKILEKHDIPLIFLSSHSEPEVVAQTEMITSYGYVVKNSEETVLVTSIKMAFRLFESKMREKERTDQLMESEKNLAEAQRIAKLGHWWLNTADNSVLWSDEVYNIFEMKKSDFGGKFETFLEHVHPEDRTKVQAINYRSRETGENFIHEYRIIFSNGRIKYIQGKGFASRNEEGKIIRLFGTIQDITDMKIVYEAYRESELKWRMLVDNSPDFIAIYDQEGKILYLNHYAEGFSENDVIGTSGFDYIPPESREEWKSYFDECLRKKTTRVFRSSGYGTNMAKRIYENYFIYLSDHVNDQKVMGITRDVTDQVEIQESLNQEIKEKELLLKEVHHRIKNNFASVENILQIHSESLAENSTCRNILHDAIGRVESMRMIYEKLLMTVDYSSISTKLYLQDLIRKIRSLYPENHEIRFETKIDDLLLNSKQIFSLGIITNELISNIMKYAFPAESQGVVGISLERKDQVVTFLFEDNGMGFSEGFDPGQSDGLGIMLINILSKQLGGNCTFQSDLGVRCRIEFEI